MKHDGPRQMQLRVQAEADADPVTTLAEASGLSRSRIKDAMTKGAVLLLRGGKANRSRRLRRAKTRLRAGDELRLDYDADVLARVPPQARRVHVGRGFSVWFKPAGLLSQGTSKGDHCSLLRQAERIAEDNVWLVHRLDREAFGLMLLAHRRDVAGILSQRFAERAMDKRYRAVVCGEAREGTLATPLDGKPATTHVTVLDVDQRHSLLELRIDSGRRHQIRRHLADAGTPVLGDPRYGQLNAHPDGLALCAWRLAFLDPLEETPLTFELDGECRPPWFSRLP